MSAEEQERRLWRMSLDWPLMTRGEGVEERDLKFLKDHIVRSYTLVTEKD